MPPTDEQRLAGARRHCKGMVVLGRDLMEIRAPGSTTDEIGGHGQSMALKVPNERLAASRAPGVGFLIMDPTPTITIQVPGPLRPYCGGAAQLSLQASSVRAALEELERTQPALYRSICDETGAVRRHLNVFVNTDHVRDLVGVDTTLTAGDEVTILPAVSGG